MLIQHAFPGRQGGAWKRQERVLRRSNHHLAPREKTPIAAAATTGDRITCPQRSGPRTIVNSTSFFCLFRAAWCAVFLFEGTDFLCKEQIDPP